MAMVNMNNLLNGKDSRWLQLEVCREFQRNKCSRPDTECKFAHPPANVEVQNGRVTACYDSIKGRCNREKPPCKYFHPPQHLKDQLLINGRNHLALKNALMQQMGLAPGQPLVPGQVPGAAVAGGGPFLGIPAQVAGAGSFSPFYSTASGPAGLLPVMPADPSGASQLTVVGHQGVGAPQKMPRSDRLEMDVKSVGGSFYYDNFAFPGMVPYKRAATDKSGVPVYQPGATTYQQLMTLQQQPYVPVTCEYTQVSSTVAPPLPNTTAANSASALIVTSAASSSPTPTPTILPALPAPSGGNSPIPPSTASPQQPTSQSQQLAISEQENGTDEDNENNNKQTSAQLLAAAAATQNYFQSVKLAASPPSSNSAISPLTALSYTGVALNKQLLSPPQPRLSYAAPATPQAAFSPQQQLLMRANQSAQMMQTNFPYLAPFMAQQRMLLSQQMVNPFAMLQQPQAPQPHHHPNFVPSTPLHHFHPYAHPLAAQQALGSSQQQAIAAAAANAAAAALSYKKMKSI